MNHIQSMQAINNINDDILDELLASLDDGNQKPTGKVIRLKPALLALAAVIAALTLAGAATTLFSPGWWISSKPIPEETVLLLEDHMSRSTGLVADDEYVRIEAAGSIKDGNSVMVAFLVTMKQMDSAVVSGSGFPIPGYHFNNCVIRDSENLGRFGCFYSDSIKGLQDNQFLYRYTLTGDAPIPDKITVELRDIGYINEDGIFTITLKDTWEWTFQHENTPSGLGSQSSGVVTIGQIRYSVEKAEVSLFGIELALKPETDGVSHSNQGFIAERNAMLKELMEACSDIDIRLKDAEEDISLSLSGGGCTSKIAPGLDDTFRISIHFTLPVPTEQIQFISMLDGQIKFTN